MELPIQLEVRKSKLGKKTTLTLEEDALTHNGTKIFLKDIEGLSYGGMEFTPEGVRYTRDAVFSIRDTSGKEVLVRCAIAEGDLSEKKAIEAILTYLVEHVTGKLIWDMYKGIWENGSFAIGDKLMFTSKGARLFKKGLIGKEKTFDIEWEDIDLEFFNDQIYVKSKKNKKESVHLGLPYTYNAVVIRFFLRWLATNQEYWQALKKEH